MADLAPATLGHYSAVLLDVLDGAISKLERQIDAKMAGKDHIDPQEALFAWSEKRALAKIRRELRRAVESGRQEFEKTTQMEVSNA